MVRFDKRGIYLFLLLLILGILIRALTNVPIKLFTSIGLTAKLLFDVICLVLITVFIGYLFSWMYHRRGVIFSKEDVINISFSEAIIPTILALMGAGLIKIIAISSPVFAILSSYLFLIFIVAAIAGFPLSFILNYVSLTLYKKINRLNL